MEHRVEHAHAGTENRHEHDLLVDLPADGLRHGRLNLDRLRPEILQRLEREELGDFAHELAKQLRRRGLVAHERHAVVDKRMVEYGRHFPNPSK